MHFELAGTHWLFPPFYRRLLNIGLWNRCSICVWMHDDPNECGEVVMVDGEEREGFVVSHLLENYLRRVVQGIKLGIAFHLDEPGPEELEIMSAIEGDKPSWTPEQWYGRFSLDELDTLPAAWQNGT